MTQKFTFAVDREHGLVRITMTGFYALEDVEAFFEARRAAHDALGLPPNQHMTLNDMRGMKIQQQEVVEAFGRGLSVREEMAARVGIVMDSRLARSQLARALAAAPGVQVFRDVDGAEAWLLAEKRSETAIAVQPVPAR